MQMTVPFRFLKPENESTLDFEKSEMVGHEKGSVSLHKKEYLEAIMHYQHWSMLYQAGVGG